MRLIWRLVTQQLAFVCLALASLIIAVACQVFIPHLAGEIVDLSLAQTADPDALKNGGLKILVAMGALFLGHVLYLRFGMRLSSNAGFAIRQTLYTHILQQPHHYFHRHPSQETLRKVFADSNVLDRSLGKVFAFFPLELVSIVAVAFSMVLVDAWLAVMVFVLFLVTFSLSVYFSRSVPIFDRKAKKSRDRLFLRLSEVVSGIGTVKAFVQESAEIERLNEANTKTALLMRKGARAQALLTPIADWRGLSGLLLVVWYGAFLILDGKMSAGGLVAFVAYAAMMARIVNKLGEYYDVFRTTRAAAIRVDRFLADFELNDFVAAENNRGKIPDLSAPIEFRDVSFCLNEKDNLSVRELNLTICRNETIALVGREGAGKHVLTGLLQRFYVPQRGNIFAGGVDLTEWDQDAWRSQIGVLSDDVFLFNCSIEANILYSQPNASLQELDRAVELSGLHRVIRHFPMGINSVIGDKDVPLSSELRRRIALARLFLHDPTVLIYDHPVGFLDVDAGNEMVSVLTRLVRGRIAILISQQPEIVKLAKRIVLIDSGQIIATGSHEEMLEAQPLYRALLDSMYEHQRRQPVMFRRAHASS